LDLVEVTALPRLLELLIPLAEAPAKIRFSPCQSDNSRKRHHKEDNEMNKLKALKETATASIVSAGQSENSRKPTNQLTTPH